MHFSLNILFIFIFPDELQKITESESRLRQQYTESQRRERILIRRLGSKEQEILDLAVITFLSININLFLLNQQTISILESNR